MKQSDDDDFWNMCTALAFYIHDGGTVTQTTLVVAMAGALTAGSGHPGSSIGCRDHSIVFFHTASVHPGV